MPPAKSNVSRQSRLKRIEERRYAPCPCAPINPPLAPLNPYPLPSSATWLCPGPDPASIGADIDIDTGDPPPLPFRSLSRISLAPPGPLPLTPPLAPFTPSIAGHAIPPALALGGVDPGLPVPLFALRPLFPLLALLSESVRRLA